MAKRYISAGAGSGKTYRITTEVANLIKKGKLKPDQVIMTTFTKAAAQELREKSKKELANIGLYQQAQEMEQALIGTVHSVANDFLSKYWYLLGILPDATVMDEEDVQIYRKHSLRDLLSMEDRSFLWHFAQTYNVRYPHKEHKSGINYEFWIKDLDSVLNFIQRYDLDETDLKDKGIKITSGIIDCLIPSVDEIQVVAQCVLNEIDNALNAMPRPNKNQRQFVDAHKGQRFDPKELEELNTIANKRGIEKTKVECLTQFLNPETKAKATDLKKYASLIFDLAVRWRKEYRRYKDEHRLIDYNDMEQLFLQLLDSPEVQEDIRSHYTHLFVDEFQDSNPVQVNIFEKLSSLPLESCYVGDKKQAIYGFRGSDTELTSSVEKSIENRETLPYSYRSVKPLVDFSNAIFEKIFKDTIEKEIVLKMPEKGGNDAHVETPLRLWPCKDNETLARQIQQLILREKINPKDIAVLARENDELDSLAEELRKCKVPVCRESKDLKESRTGRLFKALLTLVETPNNPLARAELAYLTEPGYNVTQIIETRLDKTSVDCDYLKDLPLLNRFLLLRKIFSNQSISSLVESLIIELDLYALVQQWENAQAEETNLQEFIDLARKYEDYATKWAKPATVSGFILYFSEHQQRGAANEEGVRLYTYHKAKGLEWKVVILLSLDNDVSDPYRLASNGMLGCQFHGDLGVSLLRNIYGKRRDNSFKYITTRLQTHPLWEKVKTREIREAARLLYVGVTRAKEILILAPNVNGNNVRLDWFHTVGLTDITQELNGEEAQDFFGINAPLRIEKTEDLKDLLPWPEPEQKKVHDIAVEYSSLEQRRDISPSHAGYSLPNEIVPINDQECRMTIHHKAEDEALIGDMIHQIFCCCDDRIDLDKILRLREDYGFAPEVMPEPACLLSSWDYLVSTLESRYGKSVKRHHERPFRHLDDNGHIVSGFIDLVWETADAFVIVDYKTCPGNYKQVLNEVSEHYAGRHGKQLDFYQHALEAEKSKRVLARVIYYPVTRFMVEVK